MLRGTDGVGGRGQFCGNFITTFTVDLQRIWGLVCFSAVSAVNLSSTYPHLHK